MITDEDFPSEEPALNTKRTQVIKYICSVSSFSFETNLSVMISEDLQLNTVFLLSAPEAIVSSMDSVVVTEKPFQFKIYCYIVKRDSSPQN